MFTKTRTLRRLSRWSEKPASDVETASTPKVNVLRGLLARATTPLLPDDYLKLLNPLWSARELRGQVVEVRKETEDSATVTIKPGWGFSGDYRPGQYVGIGLHVDGRVALAFLLADISPAEAGGPDLDHRQGHSRGLLVEPPGRRCETGHDRSAGFSSGRICAARSAAGPAPAGLGRQRRHPDHGDAPNTETPWIRP